MRVLGPRMSLLESRVSSQTLILSRRPESPDLLHVSCKAYRRKVKAAAHHVHAKLMN